MINVVVPLSGKSPFFKDEHFPFPKPLVEINGKTMIELCVDNLKSLQKEIKFIFVVNEEDCKVHYLDNILNLITEERCEIVKIDSQTKGAACSVLMSIEYINNDIPLVIANPDQVIKDDMSSSYSELETADAGVLVFDAVHPRWSYVRLDVAGNIVETAEKKPLSNNAIAGFYYFKKGSEFVQAAMNMIKKDANVNGSYYIAPVLNEYILANKVLRAHKINKHNYHTFYSPEKIEEYVRAC